MSFGADKVNQIAQEVRRSLREIIEGSKRYPGIERLIKSDDGCLALAKIIRAAAKIGRSTITNEMIKAYCITVVVAYQESFKVDDPSGLGPIPDPKVAANRWSELSKRLDKIARDVAKAHNQLYHGNVFVEDKETKKLREIAERLRRRAELLMSIQEAGRAIIDQHGFQPVDRPNRPDAAARAFWRNICTVLRHTTDEKTERMLGPRTKEVCKLT